MGEYQYKVRSLGLDLSAENDLHELLDVDATSSNVVFRLADLDGKDGVHVYKYSPDWAHDARDATEDSGKILPSERQLFAWVDAVVGRLAKADKIVPVPDSREDILADRQSGKYANDKFMNGKM